MQHSRRGARQKTLQSGARLAHATSCARWQIAANSHRPDQFWRERALLSVQPIDSDRKPVARPVSATAPRRGARDALPGSAAPAGRQTQPRWVAAGPIEDCDARAGKAQYEGQTSRLPGQKWRGGRGNHGRTVPGVGPGVALPALCTVSGNFHPGNTPVKPSLFPKAALYF